MCSPRVSRARLLLAWLGGLCSLRGIASLRAVWDAVIFWTLLEASRLAIHAIETGIAVQAARDAGEQTNMDK